MKNYNNLYNDNKNYLCIIIANYYIYNVFLFNIYKDKIIYFLIIIYILIK